MDNCININLDKKYFEMNTFSEHIKTEVDYIFCDDITDYTVYPYANSMKDIPGYQRNKKEYQGVFIFLYDEKKGKTISVPCNIHFDKKEIYISEGNFNKYWRSISLKICNATRMLEDNPLIEHSSINDMVDLAYAQKSNRTVSIKSYKLSYTVVEIDIDAQRLISKRASAFEDNKIRYVYNKKGGCVHDKSCELAQNIDYLDFAASENLPVERDLCHRCKRKILIRNAIKNDNKKFAWYDRFFEKGNAGFNVLERFLTTGNVELYMDLFSELQVKYKDDTWIIKRLESGKHELYHNNYVMINDNDRLISSGFHPQNCYCNSLNGIIRYIVNYDWEKHLIAKNKENVQIDGIEKEKKLPDDAVSNVDFGLNKPYIHNRHDINIEKSSTKVLKIVLVAGLIIYFVVYFLMGE